MLRDEDWVKVSVMYLGSCFRTMMLIGDLFILLLRESIRYRSVTGRLNSICV